MGGGENGKRKHSALEEPYDDNNPFNEWLVSSSNQNAHPTELRSSHDPTKLLALLAAFVGLFTNLGRNESHDSASAGQDDPKAILKKVAGFLGLSAAAAHGDGTFRINGSIEHRRALLKAEEEEEEEEEEGNQRRSKKQKITPNWDATSTLQDEESIPDSSFSTPPPPKSKELVCGDSIGHSPASELSSASVGTRSRITRSSDGKFRRILPMANENICQDSLAILRQSAEHPAVQVAFASVRATLEQILLQKVARVRRDELTVEFGLETAASIDLLKLVNSPIHGLEEIGERARRGAMLLEDGQKRVNEGKNILFSAISEIPKQIM